MKTTALLDDEPVAGSRVKALRWFVALGGAVAIGAYVEQLGYPMWLGAPATLAWGALWVCPFKGTGGASVSSAAAVTPPPDLSRRSSTGRDLT